MHLHQTGDVGRGGLGDLFTFFNFELLVLFSHLSTV